MTTCSGATVLENPRSLARVLRRLQRVDKAIARSRKVHGRNNHSSRRERLYAKMANVQNDHNHNATTAISKSAGRVALESINMAGMMHNRSLARTIADAGMCGVLAGLEYKSA